MQRSATVKRRCGTKWLGPNAAPRGEHVDKACLWLLVQACLEMPSRYGAKYLDQMQRHEMAC